MDNRTLSLILFLVTALSSGMMFAFALSSVYRRERWIWLSGFLAQSFGFILLSAQGLLPPVLSITLANMLLFFGFSAVPLGLRAFYGLVVLKPWHWILALLHLLVFVYFGLVEPSTSVRITAFSLVASFMFLESLVLVSRHGTKNGRPSPTQWSAILLAGFSMVYYVVRIWFTLLDPPTSLFDSNIWTSIFLAITVLDVIGWALLLIMLNAERLAGTLEATIAELQESNSTKDRLLAIMAHDLRGPLGNIRMLSSSMDLQGDLAGCVDPHDLGFSIIDQSVDGALSILENLMRWAQTQRGTLGNEPAVLELAPVLELAVHEVRGQAEAKNLDLVVDIEAGLLAWADRAGLEIVVRNLLGNAIKFTPRKGQVRLTSHLDKATDRVIIEVCDTGAGMDQGQIDGIFALDRRAIRRGTEGERGTGLGLVLCRDLIQAGSGRLVIHPGPGRGTRVEILLPPRAPRVNRQV